MIDLIRLITITADGVRSLAIGRLSVPRNLGAMNRVNILRAKRAVDVSRALPSLGVGGTPPWSNSLAIGRLSVPRNLVAMNRVNILQAKRAVDVSRALPKGGGRELKKLDHEAYVTMV